MGDKHTYSVHRQHARKQVGVRNHVTTGTGNETGAGLQLGSIRSQISGTTEDWRPYEHLMNGQQTTKVSKNRQTGGLSPPEVEKWIRTGKASEAVRWRTLGVSPRTNV